MSHQRPSSNGRDEERAKRLFEGAPYRAIVEDMTEFVVRWQPELDPRHERSVEAGQSFALLRVKDNAGEIDTSILPRMFEPHVTSKPGGQGLGLATVKAIVEAHTASLAVHSTPEGTTFEIAFPLGAGR
jgi:signal transduction histidine kinase